jgi:hypothetical protein
MIATVKATKAKTAVEARLGLCVIGWRSGSIRWLNGTAIAALWSHPPMVTQQVESCMTKPPAGILAARTSAGADDRGLPLKGATPGPAKCPLLVSADIERLRRRDSSLTRCGPFRRMMLRRHRDVGRSLVAQNFSGRRAPSRRKTRESVLPHRLLSPVPAASCGASWHHTRDHR